VTYLWHKCFDLYKSKRQTARMMVTQHCARVNGTQQWNNCFHCGNDKKKLAKPGSSQWTKKKLSSWLKHQILTQKDWPVVSSNLLQTCSSLTLLSIAKQLGFINWVVKLIMWIGHHKEIQKLTFPGYIALRWNELVYQLSSKIFLFRIYCTIPQGANALEDTWYTPYVLLWWHHRGVL